MIRVNIKMANLAVLKKAEEATRWKKSGTDQNKKHLPNRGVCLYVSELGVLSSVAADLSFVLSCLLILFHLSLLPSQRFALLSSLTQSFQAHSLPGSPHLPGLLSNLC